MEEIDKELMNTLLKKVGLYELLVDAFQNTIQLLEERIKYLTKELEHTDKHNELLEKLLDKYEEIESSYHKQFLN